MGPGYLLLWFVMLSTLSLLYRSWRFQRDQSWGWIGICLFVVSVTAYATLGGLELAGWVATALWLPLIYLPSLLTRKIEMAASAQDYGRAEKLAKWMRFFHPLDGFWQLPPLYAAANHLKKGQEAQAKEALEKIKRLDSVPGRIVVYYLLSYQGEWKKLLDWFKTLGYPNFSEKVGALMPAYLRTLGETGELDQLVASFSKVAPYLSGRGGYFRSQILLILWSFTGRVENLEAILPGTQLPLAHKRFWLATAHMAAGHADVARLMFEELTQSNEDERIRASSAYRLSHPLVLADGVLSETSQESLHQFEKELTHERRLASPETTFRGKPYVTFFFITINLIMFGAEMMMGGSENEATLFALGGLVPEAVLEGEWWRLIAANFLHYGPLHIGMNLFALNLVGPFMEAQLGHARYFVSYMLCGIGAMVTVTELHRFGILEGQQLVGASGCITGLIGLAAAIFLKHWHRTRTPLAWQRVTGIATAMLIQVAFDLSTRQVSFSAHISGTIIGFLLGLLWRK